MRKLLILGSAIGMLCGVPAAFATGAAPAATGSGRVVPLVIKALPSANITRGACAGNYVNQCPSGVCYCEAFDGVFTSPAFGKGTAAIAITLDAGNIVGNTGSNSNLGCAPLYASVGLGSTGGGTATLYAFGSDCAPFNPNAKNPLELLSGGFGIDQSSANLTGYGTFSGTLNDNFYLLSIKGKMVETP